MASPASRAPVSAGGIPDRSGDQYESGKTDRAGIFLLAITLSLPQTLNAARKDARADYREHLWRAGWRRRCAAGVALARWQVDRCHRRRAVGQWRLPDDAGGLGADEALVPGQRRRLVPRQPARRVLASGRSVGDARRIDRGDAAHEGQGGRARRRSSRRTASGSRSTRPAAAHRTSGSCRATAARRRKR